MAPRKAKRPTAPPPELFLSPLLAARIEYCRLRKTTEAKAAHDRWKWHYERVRRLEDPKTTPEERLWIIGELEAREEWRTYPDWPHLKKLFEAPPWTRAEAARATLQGRLQSLPRWHRAHLNRLRRWGVSPTRLLALIRGGYLDRLTPRKRKTLGAFVRTLKKLHNYAVPHWLTLVRKYGWDRVLQDCPDEILNLRFGAPPFQKVKQVEDVKKAMRKAILDGLGVDHGSGLLGHPLLESWRGMAGMAGNRKARRRAGLLKGVKRRLRVSDSGKALQREILSLLDGGLNLEQIRRRVAPEKSQSAFYKWCRRRDIRREIRGRPRSTPRS